MTDTVTRELIQKSLAAYYDLAQLLLTSSEHEKLTKMSIDFDFALESEAGRFERSIFIEGCGVLHFNTKKLALTNLRTIDNVVGHEVAHAVDYLKNGQVKHDRPWRDIMLDFGLPPVAHLVVSEDTSEPDYEMVKRKLIERIKRREESTRVSIIRPLLTRTGRRRKFSTVFKKLGQHEESQYDWSMHREDRTKPLWRVLGSGTHGKPNEKEITRVVFDALEHNGVYIARRLDAAPWTNTVVYRSNANFLDGGLRGETGNYMFRIKGLWIEGEQAVRWLGNILDLRMPEHLVEATETIDTSRKTSL